MGVARSGEAVAHLLLRKGMNVIVNERRPLEGDAVAEELVQAGAKVTGGGHPLSLLDERPDFIVKNPGIPYSVPFLQEAIRREIPIYTEIEVASWFTKAPIFGVTGSNGKTTTTTLIGEMLEEAGQNPVVAGNIGRVLSGLIGDVGDSQPIVLELSSFQLMGVETFHPKIAVLLNLYAAHLDYHGSFDDYVSAKWRLFRNMTPADTVVLNRDSPEILSRAGNLPAKVVWFSQQTAVEEGVWLENGVIMAAVNGQRLAVLPVQELGLQHNLENTLAAVAVALIAGAPLAAVVSVLRRFRGVEHRMEQVREVAGVTYYNDSKATNPDAALRALQAFAGNVVWIAGGLDRGDDFSPMIPALRERVKGAVLLGESAPRLALSCEAAGIGHIAQVASIEEAVDLAGQWAESGDVVLLSPACASWDMFKSFEERGSMFKQAVHRL